MLRELIEALPERFRRVLTLFYYEERSVIEVAQMLGLPEGTVKTNLHRARAALGDRLRVLGLADPAVLAGEGRMNTPTRPTGRPAFRAGAGSGAGALPDSHRRSRRTFRAQLRAAIARSPGTDHARLRAALEGNTPSSWPSCKAATCDCASGPWED